MNEEFTRQPPNNLDAEQAVLGSMALSAEAIGEARAIVVANDFYQPDHALIFQALCRLADGSSPVDVVSLHAELKRVNQLQDVGGAATLGRILDSVPSAAHVEHYAKLVKQASMFRGVIAASTAAIRLAYAASSEDASDLVMESIGNLTRLLPDQSGGMRDIGECVDEVLNGLEQGIKPLQSFGYPSIDSVLGGVRAGEMVILAARPSMGKSTLARNIATRVARQFLAAGKGHRVGLVWLEESGGKVGQNSLSAESLVDNHLIRRGEIASDGEPVGHPPQKMTLKQVQQLYAAGETLRELPITIEDRAHSLNAVRAAMAALVNRRQCKLILIDYLQRISVPGNGSKYQKVSEVSETLSRTLRELNVPGIVLAQLNRGVENRDDKRPGMNDLRDSGQIEQDADGIFFLHREDYYAAAKPGASLTNEAELIIGKFRDGRRGKTIRLRTSMKYQRFDDLADNGGHHPSFD